MHNSIPVARGLREGDLPLARVQYTSIHKRLRSR
jgi:hypothetical protein